MGQTNAPLFSKWDAQIEPALSVMWSASSARRQYAWATSKRRDRNEACTKAEHVSAPEDANVLVLAELSGLHNLGWRSLRVCFCGATKHDVLRDVWF